MKIGFFEESERVKSSTRLFSFLLLLFFFILNILWLPNIKAGFDSNVLTLDILMLIGVFVPKFLHKLAEKAIEARDLTIK